MHATAQSTTNYTVQHFTTKNGLAQNQAGDLAMDYRGNVWIATQGGLCRYDGNTFQTYNSSNSVLAHDRIFRLWTNPSAHLYIKITSPKDLYYSFDSNYNLRLDPELNKHPIAFANEGVPVNLDRVAVKAQKDTVLQKAMEDISLDRYALSTGKGQLYLIDEHSMQLLDTRTYSVTKCSSFNSRSRYTLLKDYLFCMNPEGDYSLLENGRPKTATAVTKGFQGLLRYLKNKHFETINLYMNNAGPAVLLYTGKDVWYVNLQANNTLDAHLIFSNINQPVASVTKMLYDEQKKILFVGTFTDGIYTFRHSPFETIVFDTLPQYAYRNNTYSQVAVNSRYVLNYYCAYDPIRKIIRPLPQTLERTAFLHGSDGHIWYSNAHTIYKADTNLAIVQAIPISPNSDNVNAFFEDTDHTIWFASHSDFGYIRNNKPVYLPHPPGLRQDMPALIFSVDKNTLWLGSENGIWEYNKTTGKFKPEPLLPGNNIREIYRAGDQGIWISTYGKGIYKYSNNGFTPLPLDVNHCLLFAHTFIEDRNGFFWIPTNGGLIQCSKAALDNWLQEPGKQPVYYYYHGNASQYTNEFNGGIYPVATYYKNKLLLSTIHGVVHFDPMTVNPLLPDANITVENIEVDNNKLITPTDHFTLSPSIGRLEINLSAPYFGDPTNRILEYNLPELNNIWYLVINNQVVYNKLPFGNYHLRIRKRTGFEPGHYAYKTIAFTVKPYWYESNWFLYLALILSAMLVSGLFFLRVRQLKKRHLLLEQKIGERTAELKTSVENLNHSQQQLSKLNSNNEKVIAIILHDIKSPLNFLSISARYFYRQLDTLSPDEIRQYAGDLLVSSNRIDKFSNELVQWLLSNQENFDLHNETLDIPILFEDISDLYTEILRQNNNSITVSITGIRYITADKNKLHLVLRNLVDNANKHCKNGNITLSARPGLDTSQVILSVADTGTGMSAEQVKSLQDGDISEPPSGFFRDKLGFVLVRNFIELMGGTYQVSSEPGKGTMISITLRISSDPV